MKQAITGQVLNIQHFCVDDGPGIRTTVFLKGCPLRCAWCHNPETYHSRRELLYRADRCILCGACVSACPTGAHVIDEGGHVLDRSVCTVCGACEKACLCGALEIAGKEMHVDEVLADVLSDRVFYETSGGGLTLSGGEPTAQPQFCEALLSAAREAGLSTAMETCGYCSAEVLTRLAPLTDLFLLDWKCTDEALHKQYTGVSNVRIAENLALLDRLGARVHLRCPLIPDVNLAQWHYDGIAEFANRYACIARIELEPYHPMGIGKADALGYPAAYTSTDFLDADAAERARAAIQPLVSVPVSVSGKG